MSLIHRSAYSTDRPLQTVAPGATVAVYRTGTLTLASLYADSGAITPLANPLTTDVNAFYSYYVDPSLGDVDDKLSGTGITAPYTLAAVLNLDPRIGGNSGDISSLQSQLNSEITNRAAADTAITQTGVRYPLGGSLQSGLQQNARLDAFDGVTITIDGTKFAGYTLTVFVTMKTGNAATSVTPVLRNATTAVDAGTGAASTSTGGATQSFTATLAAGVNQYKLQLQPSDGNYAVYGNGYVQLTK